MSPSRTQCMTTSTKFILHFSAGPAFKSLEIVAVACTAPRFLRATRRYNTTHDAA
jgi:hypothetical protein